MKPKSPGGPGAGAPEQTMPPAPACPFCGSEATELMSLFGSSALTSQYYCRGCRSAFESVKWGTLAAADRRAARGS
ncbi:MAG TPA: hypothetical protein VFL28_11865 [bacterium]|nr:hypothetical protein [bacterium]